MKAVVGTTWNPSAVYKRRTTPPRSVPIPRLLRALSYPFLSIASTPTENTTLLRRNHLLVSPKMSDSFQFAHMSNLANFDPVNILPFSRLTEVEADHLTCWVKEDKVSHFRYSVPSTTDAFSALHLLDRYYGRSQLHIAGSPRQALCSENSSRLWHRRGRATTQQKPPRE